MNVNVYIGDATPRSTEEDTAREKLKITTKLISREDRPEKNVEEMDIGEGDVKNKEEGVSEAKGDDCRICATAQADFAKTKLLMWKETEVLVGEKTHQSSVEPRKDQHDHSEISMAFETAAVMCSDDTQDAALKMGVASQNNNVGKKRVQICKEYSHEGNGNKSEMEETNREDKKEDHDDDDAIYTRDLMGFAWQIAQGMVSG